MKNYCLAIDIGASSGRHIVGWRENNEIKTDEVYRFPNGTKKQNGHLVWDEDMLKLVDLFGVECIMDFLNLQNGFRIRNIIRKNRVNGR